MGELNRLFFTNLIVLNDKYKDIPLEYNLYLIKLFEINICLDNVSLSTIQGYNIDNKEFNDVYNWSLNTFMEYYSDLSGIDFYDLIDEYYSYDVNSIVKYPDFVSYEVSTFYNEIINNYYNYVNLYEEEVDNWNNYIKVYYKKK